MKSSAVTLPIHRIDSGASSTEQDWVAVEEPLEIKLGRRTVAITMRTPGHDDELAVGFLYTEGVLTDAAQIAKVRVAENLVNVRLSAGVHVDRARLARNFYTTSSCGVCGKASIDAVKASCPFPSTQSIAPLPATVLLSLPDKLRGEQSGFERTGGSHAAGLFRRDGSLIALREDVGRHNAVDKLIGRAFLDNALPLSNTILMLSGRVSFELVQKAAMAGIPYIAAVGAPSSLAVETARRLGICVAGFVRGSRLNVYSRPEAIEWGQPTLSPKQGIAL